MKSVSIGRACHAYEAVAECQISRHLLDHSGLSDLSRSLRSLIRSLEKEAEQEYWQRVLGPIRRLAFALCSIPMPFDRIFVSSGIDWVKLNRQVQLCEQLYPDWHFTLDSIVQNLHRICAETSTPFTEPLELLHGESGGMSVVIRNPRMNSAVSSYFAASAVLRNATVVSSIQLRDVHLYNMLVAIGPCGWFPEFIFTSPRATQIHVLSFSWIHDSFKPRPVFLSGSGPSASMNRKHYIGVLPKFRSQAMLQAETSHDLYAADLLPHLPPFGKIASRIRGSQHNTEEETTLARLCYLSGDRAVFISAEEGATSLVIDSRETGDSIVRRVHANELEPEHYLLLRTSGGGDFIAAFANYILGDLAAKRRFQQAEWKDRMVTLAQERFGELRRRELANRIADTLRSQRLSEAKPENVHYWMSSKCIHPRKRKDFAAVLSFADLTERTQELWEAMVEIDSAHKSAGQRIRQMLLQKIATSSLEPLERDGEMAFDIGELGGGALSAFQITALSEEEFEIPADRIGILLEIEESLWLA